MRAPLLSIIIPTYNSINTLSLTLNSVCRQSFRDFEILVMDGGSTDGTMRLVTDFGDPRIHPYSDRDSGIYHAMNKGIDLAKGTWIYFIGSDDKLAGDDVLEKVFNDASIDYFDVVYGQVKLGNSETLHLGEFDAYKLIFRNISHQAIFMKKSVFTRIGKFDLKYKICADHIHNVMWFFDRQIKRKYIGHVVAVFGLDGISSQKNDPEKVRDLPRIVKAHAGLIVYWKFYRINPFFKKLWRKLKR